MTHHYTVFVFDGLTGDLKGAVVSRTLNIPDDVVSILSRGYAYDPDRLESQNYGSLDEFWADWAAAGGGEASPVLQEALDAGEPLALVKPVYGEWAAVRGYSELRRPEPGPIHEQEFTEVEEGPLPESVTLGPHRDDPYWDRYGAAERKQPMRHYLYRGHLYRTADARKAKQLVHRIQQILDAQQAEFADINPDMFADTFVATGADAKRFGGAPVVLVYDGAGYDYLSIQGEMAMYGSEDLRMEIIDAAQQLGFMAEDDNSWSMSFWPD